MTPLPSSQPSVPSAVLRAALPSPAATAAQADWLRLAMHLRLALQPDSPSLIVRYLALGDALVARHGVPAWAVHDRMLSLLLDTAYDTMLPIVWRLACLDACCRPMGALGPLVHDDCSAGRLRQLARRLASFRYNPESSE